MAAPRWWTRDTVALVTGANKGIGLEIVKRFGKEGFTVILTARDEQKGVAAAEKLRGEGLNIVFHPLDVLSRGSILKLASWLKQQYGGLDILMNNAAITDNDVTYATAQKVLETNYTAVKAVTRALLPLMKVSPAGARIINVSSTLGQLERLANVSLRAEMRNVDNLTEERVDEIVNQYLEDVRERRVKKKGWPKAYYVSKIALNAYTRVLSKSFQDQADRQSIYVNCSTPGYCKTDMTGNTGIYTAEQGAETPVWVALLPPGGPTGQFFSQKTVCSF